MADSSSPLSSLCPIENQGKVRLRFQILCLFIWVGLFPWVCGVLSSQSPAPGNIKPASIMGPGEARRQLQTGKQTEEQL